MVTFEKDAKSHTMARFYAPSRGPRPESYGFVYFGRLTVGMSEVFVFNVERTTNQRKFSKMKM